MVIYPTRLAVLLAAVGALAALALAVIAPQVWAMSLAWILVIAALMGVDALAGAPRDRLEITAETPGNLAAGGSGEMTIRAQFQSRAPGRAEMVPEVNERLTCKPSRTLLTFEDGRAGAIFDLTPTRRGEGRLDKVWMRWTGPFNLVWKQKAEVLNRVMPITPNVAAVKDEAIRLFAREALFGVKAQIERGEGAEFNSLRDYQPGMNLRTIDWKQSARHGQLLSKEFRTERNHHIVLALDSGRGMCEPLAGLPRIDRAINAALLLAYVSLKIGDRVGLFAFADKALMTAPAMAGVGAFGHLQRLASRMDYRNEETNFTLSFTRLSAALERRSLLVVFTDFSDPTSAELMLENLGRLMKRHLVLFVAPRDAELEAMTQVEPKDAEDVTRAVTAQSLLRERDVVIGRLRRLGAHIVDAPIDRMGPAVLNAYLDIKRRELL
ncbi:MAG: hypothetical protein JWP35_4690 [Caulobacter sp.]|nr:hypothetical protein [Caulobacter sp.]